MLKPEYFILVYLQKVNKDIFMTQWNLINVPVNIL